MGFDRMATVWLHQSHGVLEAIFTIEIIEINDVPSEKHLHLHGIFQPALFDDQRVCSNYTFPVPDWLRMNMDVVFFIG